MAKYQQIIWDWNGTILNDNEIVIKALNATLVEQNIEPIDLNLSLIHI